METSTKIALAIILRVVVCIMVGFSYIIAMMAGAMLASGGEGSGEGMMGALFGYFTSPVIMAGAWLLYPRKPFRIVFYVVASLGLFPLLLVGALLFFDSMQRILGPLAANSIERSEVVAHQPVISSSISSLSHFNRAGVRTSNVRTTNV